LQGRYSEWPPKAGYENQLPSIQSAKITKFLRMQAKYLKIPQKLQFRLGADPILSFCRNRQVSLRRIAISAGAQAAVRARDDWQFAQAKAAPSATRPPSPAP
jgi:hypothetical protein